MRYFALFLTTLILIGCGHKPVLRIDSDALPYVEKFEQAYAEIRSVPNYKIVDLVVEFVDKFEGENRLNTIGLCFRGGGRSPKIQLLRSWWKTATENGREALVNHEIGHCTLYQAHREDKHPGGRPKSLMYPTVLAYEFKDATRDEYMKELINFTQALTTRMLRQINDDERIAIE